MEVKIFTLLVCLNYAFVCQSVEITVTCNPTQMLISLMDTNETVGTLYVDGQSNSSCKTTHGQNWKLYLMFGAGGCGTITKGSAVKVLYARSGNPTAINSPITNSDITRQVICNEHSEAYVGKVTASLSGLGVTVQPITTATDISNTIIAPATAPKVLLTFSKDSNGTTKASTFTLGDTVYLVLEINGTDSKHIIKPLKCTAESGGNLITLLKEGCRNKDESIHDTLNIGRTFGILSGVSGQTQQKVTLKFDAFTIGAYVDQTLDFKCTIQVCDKDNNTAPCTVSTSCARKKRAAENGVGANQLAVHGYMVVQDPNAVSAPKSLLTKGETAAVGSSAGAMFIMLSIFVILFVIRRRRNQKADLTDNEEAPTIVSLSNQTDDNQEKEGVENKGFDSL